MAIASLLPAEILLLTLSFEPSHMETAVPWTGALLESSSAFLRIAIAMSGIFLLVISSRDSGAFAQLGPDPRPRRWEWTILHLVCYAGFFWQTGWLFAGGSGGPLDWQIAAWAAVCLAVGATWCAALAPVDAWRRFVLAERRLLLLSLVAGIAVWGFGVLAQRFWKPLAEWTLFFAHAILREIYPFVDYDRGAGIIGTDRLAIEIAPQCSGHEGLALMSVFVVVYLVLFRRRVALPKALWLLPAGLAAIWFANVLRVTAIVVVGTSISPDIAVQGFHSQAGWIAFTAIALGLIWISHRAGWVVKPSPGRDHEASTMASALLMPLIAMLATSMVTAAFSGGFDALYPATVIVTAAVLLRYRKSYRSLPFGISAVPVGIGVAVFAAWIALEPSLTGSGGGARARIPDLPHAAAYAWIAFRIFGSVVIVPIAEELAFRGYLLRKLVDRDFEQVPPGRFTWLSFVGSSVLFGLMHRSWIAGTLAGAAFAVCVYHRGRVTDAVVAHATANALIAASAIGLGWWELWL